MARNHYSGDKRRRELEKKRKKERKARERAARASSDAPAEGEDNSYLEYLNPGGPMDNRYLEPEDGESENDEDENSDED